MQSYIILQMPVKCEYGTISLLRLENYERTNYCLYTISKSCVALWKQITIPRLELDHCSFRCSSYRQDGYVRGAGTQR